MSVSIAAHAKLLPQLLVSIGQIGAARRRVFAGALRRRVVAIDCDAAHVYESGNPVSDGCTQHILEPLAHDRSGAASQMNDGVAAVHGALDRGGIAQVAEGEIQRKPRDPRRRASRVHEGAYGADLREGEHFAETTAHEAGRPSDQNALRGHGNYSRRPRRPTWVSRSLRGNAPQSRSSVASTQGSGRRRAWR